MTFLEALRSAQDKGGRFRVRGTVSVEMFVKNGVLMLRAWDKRKNSFREEPGSPVLVSDLLAEWELVEESCPMTRVNLKDLL